MGEEKGMRAEDVTAGMRVRYLCESEHEYATVLAGPWKTNSQWYCVVRNESSGWHNIANLESLGPAPHPEYCAVRWSRHGDIYARGWWYVRDDAKRADDELLGHFVRDTPDSKPRWEPAE